MSEISTLAELRKAPPPMIADVRAGFDTAAGFDLIQRTAKLFAASDIVPPQFQGNLPNCVIAVDMALRMGANPLMVCQNLYVVHGRPAWSAQFLIATMNQCGRFSAIRYEFQGKEGSDGWGCRAVATELSTGEKLLGPLITISLAKREGWYQKNGSKWQSMPELMLRYRAASWFVRAYAPEIAMGLSTAEEARDAYDMEVNQNGTYEVSMEEMKAKEPNRERKATAQTAIADNSVSKKASQPAPETVDAAVDEILLVRKSVVDAAEEQLRKRKERVEVVAPPESKEEPGKSSAMTIPCPDMDNEQIDELNCASCSNRPGCPSWE